MQNLRRYTNSYVLPTNTDCCWRFCSCGYPEWNICCLVLVLTLHELEIPPIHNSHDVYGLQHSCVHNGTGLCTRNVTLEIILRVQNGTNVCPNLKDCAKFALNIAFFVYYFAASIMTFFIYR